MGRTKKLTAKQNSLSRWQHAATMLKNTMQDDTADLFLLIVLEPE